MAKASEIKPEYSKNSFLFKGPFGFGKTLAAASFALAGPTYLSYWDKKQPIELVKFFTKERFGDKATKILDNIEYDVFDASNAGDYLLKCIGFVKDCRYTNVINDSFTFMTQAAVNWEINFANRKTSITDIKDILPDWDSYKAETSLISQCLDLSKKIPANVIWTAHPIPTTKIEGSGAGIRVSKINSIVSYGSKVAGLAPGAFTEIYHFSQQANYSGGISSKKYICSLESIGDEFAKSPLLADHIKEIDFTGKLFYEVWKEQIDLSVGKTETEVKTGEAEEPKQFTQWKV